MSAGHDCRVSSNDRLRSRGSRRAERILLDVAHELLHARLEAGLSQTAAGVAAGLSADQVWRIEHGRSPALSIAQLARLAAVLGLDVSVRLYPNGSGVRDAAQAKRLGQLLAEAAPPLRSRLECPLPQRPGERPELRSWDAMLYDPAARTGIEYESRLTDFQATARRHALKRRDDPVDSFLLVIADTVHNRRVMRELASLETDLPRLGTADVLRSLRAGKHPGTGWIFF
jgi:transcriptional regulator with XRE-family HTH domain